MAKAEAQQEDPAALAARRVLEQQREREKRARERAALGGLWSRRDVFGRFGWSVFGAFSLVSLLAAVRSAFPRVLFQPPSTFKAGFPSDYTIGEVSEKFKKDQRVWIIPPRRGSTRCSPSARTSAAPRAGSPPRTSSSAPATGAASTRPASTSRARRRARSSACASPRRRTASS